MIKRFFIITCCFSLSVFFYFYTYSPVKLIPVISVPVSNKVIVLDAGHGTPDERC